MKAYLKQKHTSSIILNLLHGIGTLKIPHKAPQRTTSPTTKDGTDPLYNTTLKGKRLIMGFCAFSALIIKFHYKTGKSIDKDKDILYNYMRLYVYVYIIN